MVLLISLLACLFLFSHAFAQGQQEAETTPSRSDERLLIVQWEDSQPRVVDQISVIFRQDSVELVTNTFSFQHGDEMRLGRFQSPMNCELESLRWSADLFHWNLRQPPLSDLLQNETLAAILARGAWPFGAVVRVKEQELRRWHPYFGTVAGIIYRVWKLKNTEWTCIDCAIYKKRGDVIVRTTRKMIGGSEKKWEVSEEAFPLALMDCYSTRGDQIECVDPQFGIFLLPDGS